jgi:hypothetical protein
MRRLDDEPKACEETGLVFQQLTQKVLHKAFRKAASKAKQIFVLNKSVCWKKKTHRNNSRICLNGHLPLTTICLMQPVCV